MWFFFVVKMKLFCIRMSFLWKLLSNKSKENLFISHCEKWFDLVDNLINFIEIVVGKEWYTPAALSVKNWTVEFTDILLSVIFFFWYSGEIKTLFTHNMVEFGLDNVRLSLNLFNFFFKWKSTFLSDTNLWYCCLAAFQQYICSTTERIKLTGN